MAEEEFSAKGINGQLTVKPQLVVISRRGILAFATQGLKGDKEIRIDQISSIQLKRAGMLTNGYIQFSFLGGAETKGGLFDAVSDENTVMFNISQQPAFLKAKEMIEAGIERSRRATSAPQVSVADEITKLAQLVEQGFLTREEFEAKKKQLLGL
ncbi:MAG: SHOCT domain-containing protein [bacterium]|nr:SHOCT domain-containing protein [bacterium]